TELLMPDPEVIPFDRITNKDVPLVGGKNASLGEMIANLGPRGVRVPPGFATSAAAFRRFLTENGLDAVIADRLDAYHAGKARLDETGAAIRKAILEGDWPEDTRD